MTVLIVSCQNCGEIKILAGAPDADGLARAMWLCPCCGAGQVVQLPVAMDARGGDLRRICGGLSVAARGEYVSAEACH